MISTLSFDERVVWESMAAGKTYVKDICNETGLPDAVVRQIRKQLGEKGWAELGTQSNHWQAVKPDYATLNPLSTELTLEQTELLELYREHQWINRFGLAQQMGISVRRVAELQQELTKAGSIKLNNNGQYRITSTNTSNGVSI